MAFGWYNVMRYLRAYRWEHILEEWVPFTMTSLRMIQKEQELEKKAMDRAKRRGPKR